MNSAAAFILRNANFRNLIVVLVPTLILTYVCMVTFAEHFSVVTGGLVFPDIQPGLTPALLFEQIRSYSPEAVDVYLIWSALDIVWPFLSFTCIALIMAMLLKRFESTTQDKYARIVLVPYVTVATDWLENVGFVTLALLSPSEPEWLALATLIVHGAKLGALIATHIVLIALIVATLYSLMQRRVTQV